MDDPNLPTIAEIVASDQKISTYDAQHTVVKVREDFAVKFGPHVDAIEAENLRYLNTTTVPVPKFYGFMTDPDSNKSFIIMQHIEGQPLEKIIPSLSEDEKQQVFEQIHQALTTLRSLEPPDYIGSIGQKRLRDGIFNSDPLDPVTSGPFANQDEMNEGMIRRLHEECVPSHMELLRNCINSTLKGHRTVFTHAGLQPKNVLVRRREDGTGMLNVVIVDWEMSGWYPEYWEFCNATVWESSKPEWLEGVQRIMTPYPQEYLMIHMIRRIVFHLG